MRHKFLFLLTALFVVGFLVRLNYLISTNRIFDLDSSRDLYMAREIALGNSQHIPVSECAGCVTVSRNILTNSSLYFYFLALPIYIFRSPAWLGIFNIINGMVFCLYVYLIAKKTYHRRVALLSLMVVTLSNFFVVYGTRTNQSYYIATFSVVIVWLLLKNKFADTLLAIILGFISMMIHFSAIPIVFMLTYKVVLGIKKNTTPQKILIYFSYIIFFAVFIKYHLNLSNLNISHDFGSVMSQYSVLNIFFNLKDIYDNILGVDIVYYVIVFFIVVNIHRFQPFYLLISTIFLSGFVRIDEYSGYYSVYYLVIAISIGVFIDYLYTKSKALGLIAIGLFLLSCRPQYFFHRISLESISDYFSARHQSNVVEQINEINPKKLPVSAGFETREYIFPFYYYASQVSVDDYLEIKNAINSGQYNQGILVCDSEVSACQYIEHTKDQKDFSLLRKIDGMSFYYWRTKR